MIPVLVSPSRLMQYSTQQYHTQFCVKSKHLPRRDSDLLQASATLNLVSKAEHAALVLVDEGHAVLRRVLGVGEEHALVALGLFFLADAAGLSIGRDVSASAIG